MDDGKVQYEKDLVVSRLEQDPPHTTLKAMFLIMWRKGLSV